MKKIYLIIIFVILLLLINYVSDKSYARYKSNIDIVVSSTSGDMICDASVSDYEIDTDGYAYFDVTVKNNKDNKLTGTYIKYFVFVEDNENTATAGLYRWYDNDGNGVSEFAKDAKTIDYYFGNSTNQSNTIRFKVDVDGYDASVVTSDVTVYCYQTDSLQQESLPYLLLNANLTGSAADNYTEGNMHEMFPFSHSATDQMKATTDYRYIGNDPYNYVYFNCTDLDNQNLNTCELWRIIGLFEVDDGTGNYEQRYKITKNTLLPSKMHFNSINKSSYVNSTLQNYLNTTYYDSFTSSAKNMMSDAKYYLGGSDLEYFSTEVCYNFERSNTVYSGNSTYWVGKIAIIYPSDQFFIYGKGVEGNCYNSIGRNPNCTEYLAQKGWMYNVNYLENDETHTISSLWTLTPHGVPNIDHRLKGTGTDVGYSLSISDYQEGIRPVLYLSTDVYFESGNGSIDSPYKLQL